ncbi:MAG: family peptidase [Ferruginibacter sp.]|nr:family peptidase [Ferruginibacter sp.]
MNKKLQIWLPLLISIAVVAGMLIGYKLRDTQPGKNFFSFEKPSPLQEVMNLIRNKYVDDVKINALGDSAIMAVLQKLDPHSVFIPAEDLQSVNEDIAGNFFGIGIEFNIYNDTLQVLNVIPDGPSFKASVQVGDKFIKVNDSIIAGKKITADQVRKLLRGDLGTKAMVTVLRKGKLQTLTITRGIIPVSSVDASYIIGNGIGYIKLNKFSQVTYREFMKSLEDLQKKGLKKLILDLRGNGGGVLDEATAIADEFLDGDKLITYTEGIHIPKKEYRCQRAGLFEQGELVVLADEGSASASEVLMGALQDWDRATIIGRRSFGKGLVQEQYDLSDGSALRLTVARYYTPIGRSIQRSYTNGEKAYYEEISNRFHDGEVISADSVKNDTTKIYTTKNGKKVYGGGGITPDIFIPIDTASFSSTMTKIYLKGTIGDFAYHYYLQNTAELSRYKTPAEFGNSFTFNDENWRQFISVAAMDSIVVKELNEKDKKDLVNRIKSSVARQIWRNEGFYEMMNKEDKSVKKAVEILSK